MAISTTQERILEEKIGEGVIYINADNPADGALVTLTTGVPAGTSIVNAGLTKGDTEITIKQEIKALDDINGALAEVAPRVTKEEIMVKVTLAEATYDKLALVLNNVSTGASAPAGRHYAKMGGKSRIVTKPLTIVSPIENEDGSVRYELLHIYKAAPTGSPKFKYRDGETRFFEAEFKGYTDLTRTKGDRLYQFVEDDAPGS